MKKFNIYVVIIIIILFFAIMSLGLGFFNYLLDDRNIIKGYYKAEEHFDPFATQDSVDYCKYYYTNEYDLIFADRYKKISNENINDIKEYFSKYREYMDAGDRLNEYDFDENIIDSNDFYILHNKSNYKKFEYFTIYFYDVNNHVLYYVHANI